MTERSKALLCGFGLLLIASSAVAITSCALLNGTLNGPCEPPASVAGDTPDPVGRRQANCQPAGSVCCRRSVNATDTLCTYPEDCYDAPYQGRCAIAADCSDSESCSGGKCACPTGQPPCAVDAGLCCQAGESCIMGACIVVDMGAE